MTVTQILFYAFAIAILIPTMVASLILTFSLIAGLVNYIKK